MADSVSGAQRAHERLRPGFAPVLSRATVARQLRELGVREGGVLLVHTSYRLVHPVEGGPMGLMEALREALGRSGTLVLPSWSAADDEPFDPAATQAATDLGVMADMFWRQPGVLRSRHSFACAAVGPAAAHIVSDPLPLPPHAPASPVGRVHELDGQVLLLGVGHEANTTLHLAEVCAGVPYGVARHCTVLEEGRAVRVEYRENDHCCERFAQADAWLRERGLQAEGPVGHAPARLMRARDLVAVAVGRLAHDPLVFLHGDESDCIDCALARHSIAA